MQVMRQEKLQVQVMMQEEEVDRHYLQVLRQEEEVDRQDRWESHIQHRGGRGHQP